MANWYTADTHFGHENVVPFCGRPFRSAGHMDTVLIEISGQRSVLTTIFGLLVILRSAPNQRSRSISTCYLVSSQARANI